MRSNLALIAVQIAGLATCVVVLWPWLVTGSQEYPSNGPRLGPVAASADQLAAEVGLPHALVDKARDRVLDSTVTLTAGPWSRALSWRALGGDIVPMRDIQRRNQLIDAGYRLARGKLPVQLEKGETTEIDAWYALHHQRAAFALAWFQKMLDRPAVNARWDFANQRLMGDVPGQKLALEASLTSLLDAFAARSAEHGLKVAPVPARARSGELQDLHLTEKLSMFETQFNARKRGRVQNLRLASSAIDGTVLMPGDEFSYNETVGERSESRGFMDAPVIVQGEIVEGVGGGACQVSSTLHAASLFAGIKVVERQNHSLPSNYIGKGLDAVVAWPTLDLKLSNTYDFPVVIHIYLDGDMIRAEVWAPREGRRVVVRREVLEELPFSQRVTVDPAREPGTVQIKRRGTVGYRVIRARIMWDDGEEDFERLPVDIYQSRPQKVVIGPQTVYPPPEDGLDPPDKLGTEEDEEP